ncbi:hypothetical protein HYFRA_00009909 [Hymenoscyphus fraxineus]|uniref:Major facilitator superfamily (MFS) profile domain-containing protein n=1 Tax=Hymenoscyphus fraxineus TaxID=746836 RepID=A0A9N9L6T8_9HELO|nr:hypothetical protein HYFRA_00009909 [Hymenoscyphus fraxineus]
MAQEDENLPAYADSTGGDSWGAQDSLRRSLRKGKGISTEVSPLLSSGSGRGDSDSDNEGDEEVEGNTRVLEWEGQADFDGVPWWRKPSVYWLIPTFFLYAIAFGGILVPKMNLTLSLICREYFEERSSLDPKFISAPIILGADNEQCRQNDEIQALVTKFQTLLTVTIGLLSAVMSPRLGALSDRYGRTRLLVISSMGGFVSELVTVLAASYPQTVNYRWFLAGGIFEGLCGSFTAGFALTHAYAADCTAPPKRAITFGYFHACLFSGIALGPLVVAIILKNGGSLLTIFYIALSIHVFFILAILLIVPESLTKKRQMLAREKFAIEVSGLHHNERSWRTVMRNANIFEPLKILWPTGTGSSRRLRLNLLMLASVDTIIFGVAMGAMNVIVFYSGFRFNWKTEDTSAFISATNVVRVTALVIILPLMNYLFRTRRANKQRLQSGFSTPEPNSGSDMLDLSIIRFAIFLEVVGYSLYATATSGVMFFSAGVFAALGGVGSPTLQSAITKHVPHNKVGQLLGATGLLHALARVLGPITFGFIYWSTVGTVPQTVFVVLASCFGIAFLISWLIRPHIYLEETDVVIQRNERSNVMSDPDILVDEEILPI